MPSITCQGLMTAEWQKLPLAGRAIAPATSALAASDMIGPTQLLGSPRGRNRVIGGARRGLGDRPAIAAIAAGVDNCCGGVDAGLLYTGHQLHLQAVHALQLYHEHSQQKINVNSVSPNRRLGFNWENVCRGDMLERIVVDEFGSWNSRLGKQQRVGRRGRWHGEFKIHDSARRTACHTSLIALTARLSLFECVDGR
jgi:hypothetical protein